MSLTGDGLSDLFQSWTFVSRKVIDRKLSQQIGFRPLNTSQQIQGALRDFTHLPTIVIAFFLQSDSIIQPIDRFAIRIRIKTARLSVRCLKCGEETGD
jgi:hypothetical protein